MADVKLSSPWVLYYRKLEALFGNDPDIEGMLKSTMMILIGRYKI